jgi:SET domain-containing protein
MGLTIEHLEVAKSGIPYTGKGLFTTKDISKGMITIEYTGEITTWEAVKNEASNVYIYFVNEDHVIDANNFPDAIARYANDARGLTRIRGLKNNSTFVNIEGRVYIKAIQDIPAGSEILVNYGKDYWDTVKKNQRISNKSKHLRKQD